MSPVPATVLLKPLDFLNGSNVFYVDVVTLNPRMGLVAKEKKNKQKNNPVIRGLELSDCVEGRMSGD